MAPSKRSGSGEAVGRGQKRSKESPFTVPASLQLLMDQMKVREPFLKWLPMKKWNIKLNKYIGGQCDIEAINWLLKQWMIPALDVVCDTFGGQFKSQEMQTTVCNILIPCLITMLSSEEIGTSTGPVEHSQGLSIDDLEETVSGTQLGALLKQGLFKMDAGLAACAQPLSEKVQELLNKRNKIVNELQELLLAVDAECFPECKGATDLAASALDKDFEVTFRTNEEIPGTGNEGQSDEDEEDDSEGEPSKCRSKFKDSSETSHQPPKSTMDLATYVTDKQYKMPEFLKNVKECKGRDAVWEWLRGNENITRVAFSTAESAKVNIHNGHFGSIYGQGFDTESWIAVENVPKAFVKINNYGGLEENAVEIANEQIKRWWVATNPTKVFDKDFDSSLLTSTAQLEALIEEAEKKLRRKHGENAALPEGTYELGEFYYMTRSHRFLSLPLDNAPALATYAYLEAELLIGLGQRAATWTKKDFQTRIRNDLKRRMARHADIYEVVDLKVMKEHWRSRREATSYLDVVAPLL